MRDKINLRKIVMSVIFINIVQVVLIISISVYNSVYSYDAWSPKKWINGNLILYMIIISVVISSFITIKNLYSMSVYGKESSALKLTLEQMEKLNITLRAQRHDFMNHLQVVYSLIELEEFSEARDYIEKLYKDIQRVNQALKTSCPAINALLQAKKIYCEQNNINMNIEISTQLFDLKIPSWELCRVLSNIIDNAIYAVTPLQCDKEINVKLYENLKTYNFIISNNGPQIPKEIINKIFEAGFTTKGDKGEGVGLSITKDILHKYNGNIEVKSESCSTLFQGYINK
jgi:sensor histidine kinase regulating citrate/malate metabolism